jgi:hypothetical protein
MAAVAPAKKIMERHLREAYLREDTAHVAFWTDAIECWARPVPEYARSESNRFILKKRAGASTGEATRNSASEATRNDDIHGSIFTRKKWS